MGIGMCQPPIHKFIQFLIEQSISENMLGLVSAREKAAMVAKYEKSRSRLIELLKHYKNNNILKQPEGL